MNFISEKHKKLAWNRKWAALHYVMVVGAVVLCAYLAVDAYELLREGDRVTVSAVEGVAGYPAPSTAAPEEDSFDRLIELIEVLTPLLAPALTYFLYRKENRKDE